MHPAIPKNRVGVFLATLNFLLALILLSGREYGLYRNNLGKISDLLIGIALSVATSVALFLICYCMIVKRHSISRRIGFFVILFLIYSSFWWLSISFFGEVLN